MKKIVFPNFWERLKNNPALPVIILFFLALAANILLWSAYSQWQATFQSFIPALDNLRQARVYLTKAYVFAEESVVYNQRTGLLDALAMIDRAQAVVDDTLQGKSTLSGVSGLLLVDEDLRLHITKYQGAIEAFRQITLDRLQEDELPATPGQAIEQRVAFYLIEKWADAIDQVLYRLLNDIIRRQNQVMMITIGIWVVFLAAGGAFAYFAEDNRRRTHLALRESEERFRVALKDSPITVFNQDCDLRYTWVYNPHPCFSGIQIVGRTDEEIFPPDKAIFFTALKQRVLKSGQAERMETEKASAEGTIYFDLNVEPLYNPAGKVIGLTCAAFDITERKKAEQSLRYERNKLVSILDAMPNGIYVTNRDHDIQYINPALEREFGSVKGRKCYQYLHNLGKPCSWCENENVFSGQSANWELYSEKTQKHYDLFGVPLRNQDGSISKLTIFHDITDRKQNEEALKSLNRTLRVISECNQILVRTHDEQTLLDEICRLTVEIGGHHLAWIGFLESQNDADGPLKIAAGYGSGSAVLEIIHKESDNANPLCGAVAQALEGRQPVILDEISLDGKAAAQPGAIESCKSLIALPLISNDELLGCLNICSAQTNAFDHPEIELLNEMAADLAYGIQAIRTRHARQRAETQVELSNSELFHAYNATLNGWANALELRERETAGHSHRVVDLTLKLAEALGVTGEGLDHIRRGALLHDIGKMGIPDSILLKPGPLTEDEWVIMRQHPRYAYELLQNIRYLHPALDIPYCHHERWDGAGYPSRLKGKEIPLAARIFAAVDVWDALITDRPYRPAWTRSEAHNYMIENSGRHFDPAVIEAFRRLITM